MYLKINGGHLLNGTVDIRGAKNAVLPLMAASLLTNRDVILNNVPDITDIRAMQGVLRDLGSQTELDRNTLYLSNSRLTRAEADYEHVSQIRASVLVMGPLLARLGSVSLPMPGGCAIGSRPLDLHMKGFIALGANVDIMHGQLKATARKLQGADIYLDFPSVGATENIMMAATLAQGNTVIRNAAAEPEIADVANMLNKMGAEIFGAGTDTIEIHGVESLEGVWYTPIPDRIEAGTFLVAGALSGGNVTVRNIIPSHISPVIAKLGEAGALVREKENSVGVESDGHMKCINIKSLPFPGFPTDMQAQMTALASFATGTSIINETIFESRFNHCNELIRMGAKIKIEDRTAVIEGGELSATRVTACDLRAGAALIIAGLKAKGETQVYGVEHIDRGYEAIEEKLRGLGAEIFRIN